MSQQKKPAVVAQKVKRPPRSPAPAIAEAEPPAPDNRGKWYSALLAVGVLLLCSSAYFALSGTMPGFEQRALSAINGVSLPAWVTDHAAKPLSNAVWGMVGLVIVLLAVPKFRFRAWQYAVAAGAAYVCNFAVEHAVGRGRPADMPFDVLLRAVQGGPGFPSGHVAVLTALGLTIWPLVSWPWRALIVVLIVAEAWSRVFLGVHAPLDVVGGIGVGMIVVATIHLLPKKLTSFFKVAQ